MCAMDQTENFNKPFSQRLIEDLKSFLEIAFLANGMHLNSVEMDPFEDDLEIESVFGDEFVFTIRVTAYLCSPKGTGEGNTYKLKDPQNG
jgi:hypothetical protein